jgi:hypothetical protein
MNMDTKTGGRDTEHSSITRVIARNTYKARPELSDMVTDPPEAPEEGSKRTDDVSGAPEGGSKRTDDVSGAPEERSERTDDVSETLEEGSERTDDGMAKPAKVSKRVEDAPKASRHASEVRGHASWAAADAAPSARPSQRPSGDAFEQAYDSLLPALLALRASEVVTINLAVPGAVTKALGIQLVLAALKERIVAALPEVDASIPEHLMTHAMALSHAHTLFLMASQDVDTLPSLAAEARKLRKILLRDAEGMIQRGLLDAAMMPRLRIDKGYGNLAFDLQLLAQLFRRCPPPAGLTAVREADLQRAEKLAATILILLGHRKKLRASIEAAADVRNRAFTLFTRVYDEVRRAVVYLRWGDGDADRLVPSLYVKNTWQLAALLSLAMIVGTWIGKKTVERLPVARFRTIVGALLMALALQMIVFG